MADYSMVDRVTRQRVYSLRMPSNAVEVEKMMTAAVKDVRRIYGEDLMDDTLRVETDDETLYLILDLPDETKQ